MFQGNITVNFQACNKVWWYSINPVLKILVGVFKNSINVDMKVISKLITLLNETKRNKEVYNFPR